MPCIWHLKWRCHKITNRRHCVWRCGWKAQRLTTKLWIAIVSVRKWALMFVVAITLAWFVGTILWSDPTICWIYRWRNITALAILPFKRWWHTLAWQKINPGFIKNVFEKPTAIFVDLPLNTRLKKILIFYCIYKRIESGWCFKLQYDMTNFFISPCLKCFDKLYLPKLIR